MDSDVRAYFRFTGKGRLGKSINSLLGLLEGIAIDGHVTSGEVAAHFSDRGRLFQADRGRRFSAIVDARGLRASELFNVSQSSTISLKRGVDGPMSMRP